MDASSFFTGKKVTLMGLGLLGRGVGDARFLASSGAELIVTDLKSETDLAESVAELRSFPNITFTLGEHRLEDFTNRDLVLYGPKTPVDSPFLARARSLGIHTTMSTALFVRLAGIPVVGVTGTRGKTTTTELIAHVLRETGKKVLLGGNIRGVSTLGLLPEVTADSIAVLELDSWQLQGFRDEKISPHIAVFTNLMSDHLDYYPSAVEYFADKANIFSFQTSGDVLVAGKAVADAWILPAHPPVAPTIPEPLPLEWELKIIGQHNKENAALARSALLHLGVADEVVRKHFASFEPVEGRLQFVKEKDGVRIYNDNNATTPTATAAALAALHDTHERIILIAGGSDKKLPLTILSDMIRELVWGLVLLPGTGTDRLRAKLAGVKRVEDAQSLSEALAKAMEMARSGDAILFSPGFASFGLFTNEYDRNDQFLQAVRAL